MENHTESKDYIEKGEVILIDKDLNWTSFNVVKKIKVVLLNKFKLKKLKVGHAGTLDPLATGLVIICTGKQTKNIEKYQAMEKEYVAEIKLGATTPSFDLETSIDKTYPYEHITIDMLEKKLAGFVGDYEQVPPVFSAKSVNGKRAYTYARKGKDIELKPNKVHFFSIEMIHFELPIVTIKVVCSKGTYIRSLARDLGEALNSGAHLTGLRRTRIGNYAVNQAMTIFDFEEELNNL
ncbi:MAG: tRNA pseudouridine(55) synthase TruB [Bacteroidales bacterium]